MDDDTYAMLCRKGMISTYMHRRRRERRIKLALTVLLTLAAVAAVAYALPG